MKDTEKWEFKVLVTGYKGEGKEEQSVGWLGFIWRYVDDASIN